MISCVLSVCSHDDDDDDENASDVGASTTLYTDENERYFTCNSEPLNVETIRSFILQSVTKRQGLTYRHIILLALSLKIAKK